MTRRRASLCLLPPRGLLTLGLLAAGLGSLACTDAQLYHLNEVPSRPNKVAFTGQACTDNPAERQFPLRVVFLVDTSPLSPSGLSGGQVATLSLRKTQAIRDVVSVLRGPDTEMALVRFGGTAALAPEEGFTTNAALINEAAGALSVPLPCDPFASNPNNPDQSSCRRTSLALSQAASLITGDVFSSPRGPRARTTYAVVLVQAGPVDDALLSYQSGSCTDLCDDPAGGGDPPGCLESCTLSQRVADLREEVLDAGAANFQFHTVDVSQLSDDPTERDGTELLLTNMSFAGGGEYAPICRVNDDGSTSPPNCGVNNLTLLGLDIQSARNVFVKKSFVVANLNARHTNEGEIPDSDGDGLADEEENEIGTDPTRRDSDGDGIGDKVEALLSTVDLDPRVPNEPVVCEPVTPTQDTDGDGLTDCEEMLLRLDPTLFDTDADGFPDLLELLFGTNFLLNDTLVDSDFDGEPNGPELKQHSDPRSHDAEARAELSYLYREDDLGIREVRFTTQPREITGVVVEDTGPETNVGNGLLVYLADQQALAWRDPADEFVGEAVRIDGEGEYTLLSGCQPTEAPECRARFIVVSVAPQILPPQSTDELLRVQLAERQCTDFRVRNVTLVETLPADGREAGMNDVRIFFNQVPQDRPESFGIFRVAQYTYQYIAPDQKTPDIADQHVESYRFVLFGD